MPGPVGLVGSSVYLEHQTLPPPRSVLRGYQAGDRANQCDRCERLTRLHSSRYSPPIDDNDETEPAPNDCEPVRSSSIGIGRTIPT